MSLFVFGLAAPAAAQSCVLVILCSPRAVPAPPAPSVPPPPPAPALPPADQVTEPVGETVDSVLKTPVSVLEGQMLNLINADRASAGLRPLQVSGWAQTFARSFSQKMMAAGTIWHNPEYFSKGRAAMGADLLSENVGYDSSIPANHLGFMRSPSHRANIMDGRLTHVGIGVAVSPSGRVYVTEDFARIPGAGIPGSSPGAPETRRSPETSASAAPAATGAAMEATKTSLAAIETITLAAGRGAEGDSAAGEEIRRAVAASQSLAPMVPGLVAGGLILLAAPVLIVGRRLAFPGS